MLCEVEFPRKMLEGSSVREPTKTGRAPVLLWVSTKGRFSRNVTFEQYHACLPDVKPITYRYRYLRVSTKAMSSTTPVLVPQPAPLPSDCLLPRVVAAR